MYVLLGSSGQITSQLARALLDMGHAVRVVGRNRTAMAGLARAGADLAVGDPGDAAFLEHAFAGARGVYTMIPPCHAEPDMRAAQDRIGSAIAAALRKVKLARIVNLSSVGAELEQGTGPIAGLHAQERRLSGLGNVLHLRPGSFMENFLGSVHAVAAAGVLPGMEAPDALMPIVATRDIAAVAARELTDPRRNGAVLLHAPRHTTQREAAAILGEAIGNPGLPYVQSPAEEVKAMLMEHGFSADAANQLEALAIWISGNAMASLDDVPAEVQPTTLEHFARTVFAPACQQVVASLAAKA